MPTIKGVLETALYVKDVRQSAEFYRRVFGFEIMVEDERICALAVREAQVLLLFKQGGTTQAVETPGGVIPAHNGSGNLHFAFAIAASEYDVWKEYLIASGITIESEANWPRGGKSLYFRDPDGHLAELATPGIWANY